MHNKNVNKIIIFGIFIFLVGGTCIHSVGSDIITINNHSVYGQTIDHFSSQTLNDEIISHAEYEKVTELILTWPKSKDIEPYFIDILRASENAVSVRINVNNFIYKKMLISTLNEEQIPINNITISITRTNSIWCRDYGPFFIEKNNKLSIVDFRYLGYFRRPIDNLYPTLYGIKNKIEFDFKANFALCIQGGNYMTDGQGFAMVANFSLEIGNPGVTYEEMKDILKQYLGLEEVIILQSEVDDGTGHIDMFSKLLDNNTVLVGQWNDTNDINYQILENNAQLLIDRGYNVVRIPMLRDPDEEKNTIWTYTNSLIINGTNKKIVLVPQYDTAEDSAAISIYEQAMPEYEIIGINSNLVIDFLGAIHCTTITVPYINN